MCSFSQTLPTHRLLTASPRPTRRSGERLRRRLRALRRPPLPPPHHLRAGPRPSRSLPLLCPHEGLLLLKLRSRLLCLLRCSRLLRRPLLQLRSRWLGRSQWRSVCRPLEEAALQALWPPWLADGERGGAPLAALAQRSDVSPDISLSSSSSAAAAAPAVGGCAAAAAPLPACSIEGCPTPTCCHSLMNSGTGGLLLPLAAPPLAGCCAGGVLAGRGGGVPAGNGGSGVPPGGGGGGVSGGGGSCGVRQLAPAAAVPVGRMPGTMGSGGGTFCVGTARCAAMV